MRSIFLILIFLVFGVILGVILGTFFQKVSSYFLARKIGKKAVESRKNFSYKDKPYDIKADIEKELEKNKNKGFFKRKSKGGVKQNGNTFQSGSEDERETHGTNEDVQQVESTANPRGEEAGSQRRSVNRNLFEKGR